MAETHQRAFSLVAAILLLAVSSAEALVTKQYSSIRSTQGKDPYLVPVELFVMSRCPDARRCEERFTDVFNKVKDIIDLKTLYIANTQGASVACMHGPMECAGDIQQLCAQHYRPAQGHAYLKTYWDFVQCQNNNFAEVGSMELADNCLDQVGYVDAVADRIRGCWSGYEGEGMLRESASTVVERGVKKSCTVYINGNYRCTHDDGKWYDCPGGPEVDDFVASICSEYWSTTGEWPAACGDEPAHRR